ncbi:hypothetical protein VTN77DRAFT_310 [Rasamsonia byssochlamydoides]|uniref:uncharacterized protein n=1 Tax=Rasamsonia byssochlamydoides TaxID=89139 RepID=UPI003743BD8C
MPLSTRLCSRGRCWILLLSPFLSLIILHLLLRSYTGVNSTLLKNFLTDLRPLDPHNTNNGSTAGHGACSPLPGMEDVLVVLKTGVTEALEKVPVHIQTTLRCVPHYVIFSDFEEKIAGVQTHDVLRNVSHEIKQSIPEFEIYNRVQQSGREGLSKADFGDDYNGPFGRINNPGWKLDKWKFLPMIDVALAVQPTAKWYIFMEADTYLMWPNLIAWLAQLDPDRPLYLGCQMQIGEIVFGHGGSGFVLSNPAMRKVSEYRASHLEELDRLTADQWAGDCVLGKVLADVGVPLTWSWPMLQGSRPWDMDHFGESYDKKTWCYPVVSYHHMTPADIEELWQFDREWFRMDNPEKTKLLLHNDVFRELILPNILAPRADWDNLSEDPAIVAVDGDSTLPSSFDDCEKHCLNDAGCLQYAFHSDGRCLTSKVVKRGVSVSGSKSRSTDSTVHSGWMTERILPMAEKLGSACSKPDWVFP